MFIDPGNSKTVFMQQHSMSYKQKTRKTSPPGSDKIVQRILVFPQIVFKLEK